MASQRKKKPKDIAKEEAVPYAVDPHDQAPPPPTPLPILAAGPGCTRVRRSGYILPEDLAKAIRHLAVAEGTSPSQVVDRWARRAELDRSMVSGLLDIQAGRMVDHEEVVRRLSKWS